MKPLCLTLIFACLLALLVRMNSDSGEGGAPVSEVGEVSARSYVEPIALPVKPEAIPVLPLREAFLQDLNPAELLRLKGEFYSFWQDEHEPDDLLREIMDPKSPPGYVDFLGRTLRNAVKKNTLENPAEVIGKLRAAAGNDLLSRTSRTHLVRALIDLDDSPETIRHISTLLHSSRNDSEAVQLVRTLSRTRQDLALEELRSFRRGNLNAFPKTQSALDEIQGL